MVLPSFSWSRIARAAFAPEWWGVVALLLLDTVWALAIGFRLEMGWQTIFIPLAGMALLALLRGFEARRTALFFEYLFLSFSGSFGLILLSYLSLASSGPLVDNSLLAFDRALGFDWIGLYRAIERHPALASVMKLLYQSLLLQGFYVTLLLGLRGETREMRELWRLSTIGCILCCLGAMLFPALGPFKLFSLESEGIFLPDMERLIAGKDLLFDPGKLTGVIEFPSFHTVLALACPYALRRTGVIFWIFVVMDAAMLLTIPFFGGHYLSDMIAGAGVFAVALGIVKVLEKRKTSAASASPEFSAASAGAYSASAPSR
jgi:hypothetical protein